MEVVTVVGARPQFIKSAALSRAFRDHQTGVTFSERIVHTGQHYDDEMSDVFFRELGIPAPWKNLHVGSGTHACQTAEMMIRLEECLTEQPCDLLVVFGDTNSTLAAALVAAKIHIPVVHIEAGLRSFNRRMPEEINRVLTDHVATLQFCPSDDAAENLGNEGISSDVFICGDIMQDALQIALEAEGGSDQKSLSCLPDHVTEFALATVHRAENTDDPKRLAAIMEALDSIEIPVVLPLHPRTQQIIEKAQISTGSIHLLPPVSYLNMVRLQQSARIVLTDSGGVQKEAYWLTKPCITMRDQTEWTELVDAGVNALTGANRDDIVEAAGRFLDPAFEYAAPKNIYGEPGAAMRIVKAIADWQQRRPQ